MNPYILEALRQCTLPGAKPDMVARSFWHAADDYEKWRLAKQGINSQISFMHTVLTLFGIRHRERAVHR